MNVSEYKPVSLHQLPDTYVDRPCQHRPVKYERVEFATLAARIHGLREVR